MVVVAVVPVLTAALERWKRDEQKVGMLRSCKMCAPTLQMQAVVAAAEADTVYESASLQG